MRLISYRACGGQPFRRLTVADSGQLEPGFHKELRLFDCLFTNVTVSRQDGNVVLDLPEPSDWQVDPEFLKKTLIAEYIEAVGKYTPSIESLLDAHTIKGALPNVVRDHDAFVQLMFDQISALPQVGEGEIQITKSSLSFRGLQIDTWELYAQYLMVGRDLYPVCGTDGQIHFNNNTVPEHGLEWWLREHNKQLMGFARDNNLLAAYFSFSAQRHTRQVNSGYTFVTDLGLSSTYRVRDAEFYHLYMLGKFPRISIINEKNGDQNVSFDYRKHLPEEYHEYRDAMQFGRSDMSIGLLRFI